MTFNVPLSKRIVLFICMAVVGFFITQVVGALLIYKFGAQSTPAMRILAIVQDLFTFIIPALATALLITRTPATFLTVDRQPPLAFTIIAVCALIVSIPAMNFVIYANESIKLPESMAAFEEMLRQMEDTAQGMVITMQGNNSVGSLIMSILIVGIFAALAEEMFFRGTLQRLFTTGKVNPHAAIWIVAFIFSALHMQFYGFIPRMLLGAFFGYALYWSGSVWVPVILHAFNNSMYVCSSWYARVNETTNMAESIGYDGNTLVVLGSAAFTTACIMLLRTQKKSSQTLKS